MSKSATTIAALLVVAYFCIQLTWLIAAHTNGGTWIFESAPMFGFVLPLIAFAGLAVGQLFGNVRFPAFANVAIVFAIVFFAFHIIRILAVASAAV